MRVADCCVLFDQAAVTSGFKKEDSRKPFQEMIPALLSGPKHALIVLIEQDGIPSSPLADQFAIPESLTLGTTEREGVIALHDFLT